VTYVKICGLRDAETAVETLKAGADFIGLMFADSRRKVTPQECYDICEALRSARRTPPPSAFEAPVRGDVRGLSWYGAWSEAIEQALFRWRPLIVGVFADQTAAEVNDIAEAAGLDMVQLSGGEPREYVREIERPVIKALHVSPQDDASDLWDRAGNYLSAGLLLDTAKAGFRGGTGEPFDWEVAAETAAKVPFLLAGGLSPENVAAAVTRVRPWAVDVSSGVESNGSKDIEKIRAFSRAVKEADRAG
jgi:phosphoribosylanthranilate isomerase